VWEEKQHISHIFFLFQIFCDVLQNSIIEPENSDDEEHVIGRSPRAAVVTTEATTTATTTATNAKEERLKKRREAKDAFLASSAASDAKEGGAGELSGQARGVVEELLRYRCLEEDVNKARYLTIINFAYHFFQVSAVILCCLLLVSVLAFWGFFSPVFCVYLLFFMI
jgi:hypothetical protein